MLLEHPPTPRLKELTTFPGFDELRRRAERSGKELITIAEQGELSLSFHHVHLGKQVVL